MRSRWKVGLGIAGVVLLAVLAWHFLEGTDSARQAAYDLDRDGILENCSLQKGRLTISQGEEMRWQSPPEWNIKAWAVGDVTGDQVPELVMLLWKYGSFAGPRPGGQPEEEERLSCHLFVYQLLGRELLPRWCSSALDRPVRDFSLHQEDAGPMHLIMEEGAFSLDWDGEPLILGPSAYSDWAWEEWGFYRQ